MTFDITPGTPLGLAVSDAAKSLGVSKASAYRAISRGDIPAYRLGRRLIVPVAALERLLTSEPRCLPSSPSAARVGGRGGPGPGVLGPPPPSLRSV